MRILVIEDHVLLAQCLAVSLRQEDHAVHVTAPASDAEVVEAASAFDPTLVLLDLDFGDGRTGLPLIGPLSELGAWVVMLTGVTDRMRLAECVEAGAVGIIDKTVRFDKLLDALAEIAGLGALMSTSQRQELLAELRRYRAQLRRRLRPFEKLTQRERQVLRHLQAGLNSEEIAQRDFVSITTVRTQIRAILQKLGVRSQLSAVAAARDADRLTQSGQGAA